jgi:hypothetical protein
VYNRLAFGADEERYVKRFESTEAGRKRLMCVLSKVAQPGPEDQKEEKVEGTQTNGAEGAGKKSRRTRAPKKPKGRVAKLAKEFTPLLATSILGRIVHAALPGGKPVEAIAGEVALDTKRVVQELVRARTSHGLDHAIDDGVVSIVLRDGQAHEDLFRKPREKIAREPKASGDAYRSGRYEGSLAKRLDDALRGGGTADEIAEICGTTAKYVAVHMKARTRDGKATYTEVDGHLRTVVTTAAPPSHDQAAEATA